MMILSFFKNFPDFFVTFWRLFRFINRKKNFLEAGASSATNYKLSPLRSGDYHPLGDYDRNSTKSTKYLSTKNTVDSFKITVII